MNHSIAYPIAGVAVACFFLFLAVLTVCRQFAGRGRRRTHV